MNQEEENRYGQFSFYKKNDQEPEEYQDLGQYPLLCPECEVVLATVMQVTDANCSTRFVAKCPCGEESFIQTVEGKVCIAPGDDFVLTNIVYADPSIIYVEAMSND